MKSLDKRITNTEARAKMKNVHLGKINTCDQIGLFFREFFGCFPDNVLNATN